MSYVVTRLEQQHLMDTANTPVKSSVDVPYGPITLQSLGFQDFRLYCPGPSQWYKLDA